SLSVGLVAWVRRRCLVFFFFQAEDGIRDWSVTGVQTCALPISDDEQIGRHRESGALFAVPTYLFIVSFFGMLVYGFAGWAGGWRSEERRVGKEGGVGGGRDSGGETGREGERGGACALDGWQV